MIFSRAIVAHSQFGNFTWSPISGHVFGLHRSCCRAAAIHRRNVCHFTQSREELDNLLRRHLSVDAVDQQGDTPFKFAGPGI